MGLRPFMKLAIEEAHASLREGNNGFGAVIVRDGRVIAASHDREDTEHDPTSHAEINAIKQAGKLLGKKLSDCVLVSTHEPCPMCAYAIIWAGISTVAYGYSIRDAISQGRKRIDLPCKDAFEKTGANIAVYPGVMQAECSVLYREDVRNEIENLRNAGDDRLDFLCADSIARRIKWFQENKDDFAFINPRDPLDSGYRLLLERLRITPEEAPVRSKTDERIVFHSKNFCPTLEACKILGLDTRHICKKLNETSTDLLVKQIDRRLTFSRNYSKLRPYAECCEEMISITAD